MLQLIEDLTEYEWPKYHRDQKEKNIVQNIDISSVTINLKSFAYWRLGLCFILAFSMDGLVSSCWTSKSAGLFSDHLSLVEGLDLVRLT